MIGSGSGARTRHSRRLRQAQWTWLAVAVVTLLFGVLALSFAAALLDSAFQPTLPELCEGPMEAWSEEAIRRCSYLIGPAWSRLALAGTPGAIGAALLAASCNAVGQAMRTRADVANADS